MSLFLLFIHIGGLIRWAFTGFKKSKFDYYIENEESNWMNFQFINMYQLQK